VSRLPEPGADENIWGEILNDFLAVSHMDDGTVRTSALPPMTVSDGSITPAKLSDVYIPLSQKANYNGVASLDGSAKVPLSQLPSGFIGADASTSSKGIIQLAGDLSGTATAPTVPGLAAKYVLPVGGIPQTDLSSDVQTKLETGGSIGDATSTVKGILQLAGDLAGTAAAPTVPGLSTKLPLSQKGAANGVATLDGTGHVPLSQLPTSIEPDATASTKGIIRLTGDLGGTADSPTVPGLALKADDTTVVHLAGTETIVGVKTFTSSIEVPDPVNPLDTANKQYVDTLFSSGAQDASTTAKGVVQLAGDLGGTATAPTVPTKISLTEKGAANGVATLDSSGKIPIAQMPYTSRVHAFSSSGTLVVSTGSYRIYNDTSASWTIQSVRANVGTAPTGASVIVDVNIDGTTIFTTQANRPTIAVAGFTSGKVTNMNITTVAAGSYLSIDIDQIGSTIAGSNLTVQVEVQ
jgi:hypothetical protein